jgi:hypothetical protein
MWLEITGSRRVVSTLEDYRGAVTEIAMHARRTLCIYTPDFEPSLYDHDCFLEPVKRFVLTQRHARVRVLVCHPPRAGHRFMQMARRLSSCIHLRKVLGDHRDNACAYIVADDTAIAYRAQASRWSGVVEVDDRGIARRHVDHFENVWSASLAQPELQANAGEQMDFSRYGL